MSLAEFDDDDELQTTVACRYVLVSVAPDGELEIEKPHSPPSDAPDPPAERWILVQRPSDPPRSGVRPVHSAIRDASAVELHDDPQLISRVLGADVDLTCTSFRPARVPDIEIAAVLLAR